MELLFIRHALPLRVEGFEGPADPELSEAGHHQARYLAEYLAFERIHAIFASPLRRAVQTAEPVAAKQSIEVTIAEGIAEYDREASEYIPIEQLKAEGLPGWQDVLKGDVHRAVGVDPARVPRRRRSRPWRRSSPPIPARRWQRSATAA